MDLPRNSAKSLGTSLKDDIMSTFQDLFRKDIINASLNETYIFLIPKKVYTKTVGG